MLSVVVESDGNDAICIVVFGVVGLCLVIYGISQLRKRGGLLKHGVSTKGFIECIVEEEGEDGPYYYPMVKFLAGDDWIAGGHKMSSIANNYHVGDEVKIKFDRNDPHNFMIDHPGFLDGPSVIVMAGFIFLLFDVLFIVAKMS